MKHHHFFTVHCVHFICFFLPPSSSTADTPHPSRWYYMSGLLLQLITIIDRVSLWETFPILIVITIITTIQNHDHGVESTPYIET
ncbi:hypothetical protein HOY80DRAFT_964083 [Tuber brumale]|nr:hypothetical protein HOY80DRAFT_964083 [Tuber brumale]